MKRIPVTKIQLKILRRLCFFTKLNMEDIFNQQILILLDNARCHICQNSLFTACPEALREYYDVSKKLRKKYNIGGKRAITILVNK